MKTLLLIALLLTATLTLKPIDAKPLKTQCEPISCGFWYLIGTTPAGYLVYQKDCYVIVQVGDTCVPGSPLEPQILLVHP